MSHWEFLQSGLLFAAALWVAYSCIVRILLLKFGRSDTTTVLSYICIALWAASYLLGLKELQPFGIVGVATLFWAGRKRWLTAAPEETRRRQV